MNRIIITMNEHGEVDRVFADTECRVFIWDHKCKSEPLYEYTEGLGKITGVKHIRDLIGDELAATIDSVGPWKPVMPEIKAV